MSNPNDRDKMTGPQVLTAALCFIALAALACLDFMAWVLQYKVWVLGIVALTVCEIILWLRNKIQEHE